MNTKPQTENQKQKTPDASGVRGSHIQLLEAPVMQAETEVNTILAAAHSKSLADIFIAYGDSICASDDAVATTAPTARRLLLLDAGFSPIPAKGKATYLKGWAAIAEVTKEQIALWAEDHADHANDGLLTKHVPGFDVDIMNQAAAEAVEVLVRERFAGCGQILIRIGLAPKRLIPFRTDAPFDKITANLVAPDGKTGQKIEFLANGQMFVAFGIHPDTREPYTWHGGEPGQVKRSELPAITEAEAKALVDDAKWLLIDQFGYCTSRNSGRDGGGGGSSVAATGTR